MDFHQLLQRATSNQFTAEKKHEHQRIVKEREEGLVKNKQELLKKNAAAKLKEIRDQRYREKLKYKGISNSLPSNDEQSQGGNSKYRAQSSHPLNESLKIKYPNSHPKSEKPVKKNDKVETSKNKSGITKEHSKKPLTSASSSASAKHRDSNSSVRDCSKSSVCSKDSATARAPSQSANFQDLMKLAAQNSVSSRNSGSGSRNQLSSKVEVKSKYNKHPTPPFASRSSVSPGSTGLLIPRGKSRGSSPASKASSRDSSPAGPKSKSPLGNVASRGISPANPKRKRSSPACRPNSATDTPTKVEKVRSQPSGDSERKQTGARNQTTSRHVTLTRRPLRCTPGSEKVRLLSARAHNKVATGASKSGLASKSTKASAFYGSAAANILGQGQKSRPSLGGRYTSTWVDEMSEYLHTNQFAIEEEEDSDLEGFVTSDEEFLDDEAGHDYSSEIRKIFGYDRRRFDDQGLDDGVMESSFAQQEFEENRSARIGLKEDEDDFARERAGLKRKKHTHNKSSLKQTKLSF